MVTELRWEGKGTGYLGDFWDFGDYETWPNLPLLNQVNTQDSGLSTGQESLPELSFPPPLP